MRFRREGESPRGAQLRTSMRGILTVVLAVCSVAAVAVQQAQALTRDTLQISVHTGVGESAILSINRWLVT